MEYLKEAIVGTPGRLSLGLFIGSWIARVVDAQPMSEAVGLALVLSVFGFIAHMLISNK